MDEKILINLLAELAAAEEDLAAADHVLERSTSRERDLRDLQAEYAEDAALAQQGTQAAAVRLRGKENEIKATEAALALKRDQEIGISDRRQYQALQTEIKALESRLSVLEDEALALLAEAEAADTDRTEAESDQARQAQKGGAEISRLDAAALKARRARDAAADELLRVRAMLPEAVRRHVQRLQKNGGRSAVRVESGACGGCFGQLPAQQAIDADRGRAVVRCAGCARFVVHRPWR